MEDQNKSFSNLLLPFMDKKVLFSYYSFVTNLSYFFLDVFPPFLRNFIFRCIFQKVGNNVFIDYGCYFRYPSKMIIGNNVSINRKCGFYGSLLGGNYTIKIGENVAIGPEVTFFGAGHDQSDLMLSDIGGNIIIEDNVWIGGKSILLHGITIGQGSIVAAGSVVTKDVEPYSIIAGIPAKMIKRRVIKKK
jgi:acetyltransferase-like isoleucine patch superfamily enzyme